MTEIDLTDTRPMIDLARHHARHPAGDITAYLTWTIHNGAPCIVLVPATARAISHERVIPCVVPLASAWLWDETMGDAVHVARTSVQFANALGINPYQPSNILKITVIIRDLLGDLLRMPSMPAEMTAPVAEMLITDNNTGREVVKEVIDHV